MVLGHVEGKFSATPNESLKEHMRSLGIEWLNFAWNCSKDNVDVFVEDKCVAAQSLPLKPNVLSDARLTPSLIRVLLLAGRSAVSSSPIAAPSRSRPTRLAKTTSPRGWLQ